MDLITSDAATVCGVCGRDLDSATTVSRQTFQDVFRPLMDNDSEILGITNELCHKLGIMGPLTKVVWNDHISGGRKLLLVRSDEPEIDAGVITLAQRARGKLGLEDWRPLIASSLAYNFKLFRKMGTHLLTRLFIPSFVLLSTIALVSSSIYASGKYPIYQLLITTFALSIAFTWLASAPSVKHTRLLADRMAANVTGKEAFLNALSKVNSNGFEDVSKLEKRSITYVFSSRPKLSHRVQSLQSWTPEPLAFR